MINKKLPDRYFYPAIFTYEEGKEIAVVFPDLNCATSGEDDTDALLSARELLSGRLVLMEQEGITIPPPTDLSMVESMKNERVVLVDAYMPTIRLANNTKSVTRTVTLPAWLNALALEHNVNFSQTLQDALKKQLNIA